MATLRINTTEFKYVCGLIRSDMSHSFDATEESIYSFYRWYMNDMRKRFMRPATSKETELRNELQVAARTAGAYAATEAQIGYIVSLAAQTGDYNVLSGGRLTKAEASRIIEEFKAVEG